jgi:hypothetical protein
MKQASAKAPAMNQAKAQAMNQAQAKAQTGNNPNSLKTNLIP